MSIPEIFLERLTEMFGVSLSQHIQATFVKRPITFRVNTIKATKQDIQNILLDRGFKVKDVSWYEDAFVLQNKWKQDIMDLDIYKEGKIYMQSLASMLPVLILDPQTGEKVLDLTAAPGSKTSQIAALMDRKGTLIANDNNHIRFPRLKHNMRLLGVACDEDDFFEAYLKQGSDLVKKYREYFDKILLDAPCSGEARFLADKPKSFSYWHEQKVKEMAVKQSALLRVAWSALKPGGILVYSTCTFAPEENELQVTAFMEDNPDCEVVSIDFEGVKTLPIVTHFKNKHVHPDVVQNALRIMPDEEIEGFFMVKLKKG